MRYKNTNINNNKLVQPSVLGGVNQPAYKIEDIYIHVSTSITSFPYGQGISTQSSDISPNYYITRLLLVCVCVNALHLELAALHGHTANFFLTPLVLTTFLVNFDQRLVRVLCLSQSVRLSLHRSVSINRRKGSLLW